MEMGVIIGVVLWIAVCVAAWMMFGVLGLGVAIFGFFPLYEFIGDSWKYRRR